MNPTLAPFASDFGRLVQGAPAAVVRPASAAEVTALVRRARKEGSTLTPRGQGLSQGGQSVAPAGLALDLSGLATVEGPDEERLTISCEGGARWREVLERCLLRGLMPEVLPLNLDLTVGGVLSVGGIGATSHLAGPVVSTVTALEVVTGTGEQSTLTAGSEAEPAAEGESFGLWDAVLGGVGRCGVITRAELRLRPFAPGLRTFYLLYDSFDAWLTDQRLLAEREDPPQWMEGFATVAAQGLRNTPAGRGPFGVWFYGLHLSWEHGPGGMRDSAPDPDEVLSGLAAYRLVHIEDAETATFPQRYEPRFRAMRAVDGWEQPHPWVEAFLSLEGARRTLPELLDELPLSLGDGHRLMFVAEPTGTSTRAALPASLALPEERPIVAFAILPPGLPPALRESHLTALRAAHERLVAGGGKRYLSGWLEMMDDSGWRRHFGSAHQAWEAAKRRFDPAGVFASALFTSTAEEDRKWTR